MILHPAYLWIGHHQQLRQAARHFIKAVLCSEQGCGRCSNCHMVEQQNHYSVRWLVPEGQYTVKQLEVIFETIVFALPSDHHFFFVIERAELLNHACANSLLKSLEEPPVGYHFLLLAQNTENILPTMRSRCIIKLWTEQQPIDYYPLFTFFTRQTELSLVEFSKELEQSKIAEYDMLAFIESLYSYWLDALKAYVLKNNITGIKHAKSIITMLDNALQHPPMPGSSKLFLRNLFLKYALLSS
jgi:DNA polymerase III, delta subunit